MNCEHCFRKVKCLEKLESKDWCGGCVPGTRYITYPECKEYYNSGALHRIKKELIPLQPPWTTWNGILKCEIDSKFAPWLKSMDPHSIEIIEGDKKFLKGLWTASKSSDEFCIKLN